MLSCVIRVSPRVDKTWGPISNPGGGEEWVWWNLSLYNSTHYLCTKTPLVVQFQIRCYEKEEERNGFWWNNNFFDSCPPAHTDLPACSLSENKSTKFFGEVSRHHLTTPPAPTPAWKRHATWTVLVLLMPEAVLPPLLPLFQLLHWGLKMLPWFFD